MALLGYTVWGLRDRPAVQAVQAFADPEFAGSLMPRLRDSAGRLPRYYQVLLRARLKGGVATEISYLLHRELRVADGPAPQP